MPSARLVSEGVNDFVEVGLLRGALYAAAEKAGADGLRHDVLTQRVFDALKLPIEVYSSNPAVKFQAKHDTDKALRTVLGYRLYRDLKRGCGGGVWLRDRGPRKPRTIDQWDRSW